MVLWSKFVLQRARCHLITLPALYTRFLSSWEFERVRDFGECRFLSFAHRHATDA
jgi:hypothetical protein